jgi:hypothetical protein
MASTSAEAWSLRATLMLSGLLSSNAGVSAAGGDNGAVSADAEDATADAVSLDSRQGTRAAELQPPPFSASGAPDYADLPPEDLHEAKRCMEMALGLWREPLQVSMLAVRSLSPPFVRPPLPSIHLLVPFYRSATRGCCKGHLLHRRSQVQALLAYTQEM